MRRLLLASAALALLAVAPQARAQMVVTTSSCTGNTPPLGTNGPLITNSSGQLCIDAGAAASTVTTSPLSVTTTDKSGTITLGGTAQTAIALNASRKTWCIQNPGAASEKLYVRANGTASATTGAELAPGAQACSQSGTIDTAAISVFAATTAHAYLGFEKQ